MPHACISTALSGIQSTPRKIFRQIDDTCADFGTPLSVWGSASYFRDCSALGISLERAISNLRASKRRLFFGKTVYKSLGVAPEFFATSDGKVLAFSRDVIDIETIPSTLGLATMRETKAVILVSNKSLSSAYGWSANLSSKNGHLYLLPPELVDHDVLFQHFRRSAL